MTRAKRRQSRPWPTLPRFPIGDLVDRRLTGSACKGQAPMFDPDPLPGEEPDDTSDRLAAAAATCQRCPVLALCATAAAEQGNRAVGVWAGRVRGQERRRATPPPPPTQPDPPA